MTEAETLSEVPTAVPSMRAHLAKASTPCTFTTRAEPPAIISTARPVRPFLGAERSLFVGHHGNLVFGSRRTASTPGGGPGVWRGSEGRYRRRTPMLKATFRRVHQAPKRRRLEDRHRFIGLCSDDGDRVAECPEFFDSLLELHPELGVGELDLWPFLPFSPPDLHPAQR